MSATFADPVERHADAAPDKPAIRFAGAALSYAGLTEWAAAAARGLREAYGVGPGDRVAVLARNHPGTLVLLLACARLGAMLVPLNRRLAAAELAWIVGHAAPRVLAVDAASASLAPAGVPVLDLDAGLSGLDGGGPGRDAGAGLGRPLLLVYTSGTTGRPKGAVLTGDALLAHAALSVDMHDLSAADHVLTVLPLFHVGGLNIQTTPALLAGATVTLHPRFSAPDTLAAIAADRPTLTVLVPSTLRALIEDPAWPGADLSSLRAVATGSTVVPPHLVAPLCARGVTVLEVYGATETAPIAIYEPLRGGPVRPGPGCEARAVDDAGRDVPPGTPGEVWVHGPQLFRGYWRDPAATAAALCDGWFRTGDVGTQAPDGSWTVHDRRGHLIVSGGENVYPAEVERALHEHPAVLEAAVVGRPDPRWQEVPVAFVVPRPGRACDAEALRGHLLGRLARYKVPREFRVVPVLPRNAMGKVRYAALKAALPAAPETAPETAP